MSARIMSERTAWGAVPQRAGRRRGRKAAAEENAKCPVKYQPVIEALCRADKLPVPVFELRFAPPRKWRFDVAWPSLSRPVALEIQGGLFVHGRHSRGAALEQEHEKLNAAAALGYRVLFSTPRQLATHWPSVVAAVRGAA